MEIQSIVWRELKSSENLKITDNLLAELENYLGNDEFHILGVMNDGKEKIVINLIGYKEHLENNLGVPYNKYYDEDQEMDIEYPVSDFLRIPFHKVQSIFESHNFNVDSVRSTCLDLEDFSINIRVEILV